MLAAKVTNATRGREVRSSRRPHKPKIMGSNPIPATRTGSRDKPASLPEQGHRPNRWVLVTMESGKRTCETRGKVTARADGEIGITAVLHAAVRGSSPRWSTQTRHLMGMTVKRFRPLPYIRIAGRIGCDTETSDNGYLSEHGAVGELGRPRNPVKVQIAGSNPVSAARSGVNLALDRDQFHDP